MYGVMDPEGVLVKHFPLPAEYKSMYHDFAITKNYVVIAQMPLVFDPQVRPGHRESRWWGFDGTSVLQG
jgi:carotenoid cleavage dioxygenase-like enzyme